MKSALSVLNRGGLDSAGLHLALGRDEFILLQDIVIKLGSLLSGAPTGRAEIETAILQISTVFEDEALSNELLHHARAKGLQAVTTIALGIYLTAIGRPDLGDLYLRTCDSFEVPGWDRLESTETPAGAESPPT